MHTYREKWTVFVLLRICAELTFIATRNVGKGPQGLHNESNYELV